MNKNNNITNINEYRDNKMPDNSGFNINEPNDLVEYVSDEMINSYVWEIGNSTPDLWSRIEVGFEEEAKAVARERKRKSTRVWKTLGYVAAAVVITIIAVPVMKLGMGEKKSEESVDMIDMEATESYDNSYDEVPDSVTMEAAAESDSQNDEEVSNDVNNEQLTQLVPENGTEGQLNLDEIRGVQTDSRKLTVVCAMSVDEAGNLTFEIKEVKVNEYEEINVNAGDKITLSNPLFVEILGDVIREEEITLDSLVIDDNGNIIGRIIDLIKNR